MKKGILAKQIPSDIIPLITDEVKARYDYVEDWMLLCTQHKMLHII